MKYTKEDITPQQKKWLFLAPLIVPVIVIPLSGHLFWAEGWIFSVWFITVCCSITLYLYHNEPDMLVEICKRQLFDDPLGWDRSVFYVAIGLCALWLLLMPIDAKLFNWSKDFPSLLADFGILGLLLSFFLLMRAFVDNTHLLPLIPMQLDRKQEIPTLGVYNVVRHPLYLGIVLMFIFAPIHLGSLYGLIVGVLLTIAVGVRIVAEEEMLVEKFDGYINYRNRVRYRLIPFIW